MKESLDELASFDKYDSETFRVQIVHWISKGSDPPHGWRAQMSCQVCKINQMLHGGEPINQTLDAAMDKLKSFIKRPICESCEAKIKRYKK